MPPVFPSTSASRARRSSATSSRSIRAGSGARSRATVKGFAVYQHAETPGLGGEIEKRWFRDNWVGKKIVTREGRFVSVGIAKGRAEETVPKEKQLNYVDGISGATLTGKYLAAGIKDTLSRYEPVSIKFRKNLLTELGLPSPAASN
jgi:Na+-transporting NADH:ubiquinone oxidoreductase subunit NqrC